VYDILRTFHWSITGPHNGSPFSTADQDNDMALSNCGLSYGGGWWFTACSLFTTNTVNPIWYSWSDDSWYYLKNTRLMVKLQ